MGSTCECVCNSNANNDMRLRVSLMGEEILFSKMGRDNKDVTENYQYHQTFIDKNKIKLSYSDLFYREAFRPMHLMHFTYFNKLIDDFLEWYGV